MNLLEHEAKELLKRSDLKVPEGHVFSDVDVLSSFLNKSSFPLMIKGQVPVGGRGKIGAVRKVNDVEETLQAYRSIKGMKVKEHTVESVLVERFVESKIEYYLAIFIDRVTGRPQLLVGRTGGMDVESSKSSDIKRLTLDPFLGIDTHIMNDAMEFLNVDKTNQLQMSDTLSKLWVVFTMFDCELVEINPLIVSNDELICLDAKMTINDDSLFRHKDLDLDFDRERTSFEMACRQNGFSGVHLDGNIAVIANGAGLTMAVLDELDRIGLKGGAFLDLGGVDDPSMISKAMKITFDRRLLPTIEGVMVCIFGGLTRCDVVATGVLDALKDEKIEIPIVTRLRGADELEGRDILTAAGHRAYTDLEEACESLKRAVRLRT